MVKKLLKKLRKPITIRLLIKSTNLGIELSPFRYYPKHFIAKEDYDFQSDSNVSYLLRNIKLNKSQELIDELCIYDLIFTELWKEIGTRVKSIYKNHLDELVIFLPRLFIIYNDSKFSYLYYNSKNGDIISRCSSYIDLQALLSNVIWKHYI